MRLLWFTSLFVFLSVTFLPAQQPAPQPIRDASAIAVLHQAINGSGGLAALSSIQDYTASGKVTFQRDQVVSGTVTITGRGNDFRIDSNLPDGLESWLILGSQGAKRDVDGTVSALSYQQIASLESFNLPLSQLASAITNASVNVSYIGSAVRIGRQVLGVRVRTLALPHSVNDMRSQLLDKEFYFDAATFQLVAVEDLVFPKDRIENGIHHRIQFSNYQQVQGVMVPFSISDSIGDQGFTSFTLTQVSFNAGYADSQFQP